MTPIERLTEYFLSFPGIGARQARRFTYFLLERDARFLHGLADAIRNIRDSVEQCPVCKRYFSAQGKLRECSLCRDPHTDRSTLLVVEKDADLENIRKTNAYLGSYFIIGGTIPLFAQDPKKAVRAEAFVKRVKTDTESGILREVIFALSLNPEGENTTEYLKRIIEPFVSRGLRITTLGRGLSTGIELEYSDSDTLKNALKNRG